MTARSKPKRDHSWTKRAHVRAVYGVSPHWLIYFDEHPPKPNQWIRGTFGPNAFKVRMAMQAEIKRWRSTTERIVRDADIPFLGRVRISSLFVRVNVTYRPSEHESMFGALNRARGADQEGDRASLKPIIDGLIDAGIVPDDNRAWIIEGSCNEQKGPRGVRQLVVRIDPMGGSGE